MNIVFKNSIEAKTWQSLRVEIAMSKNQKSGNDKIRS